MLIAITIGTGVSLINIAIHGLMTVAMVRTIQSDFATRFHHNPTIRLTVTMVLAAAILMAGHLLQVLVWSQCYRIVGVTPDGQPDFYFAFVNYTTLGYGDILPLEPWRVMGPMTAMNGVLLFGWSTALLFQILSKTSSRQIGLN